MVLQKKEKFIDLNQFKKQQARDLKWLSKNISHKDEEIYEIIIPINEKLFKEKYLRAVYVTTPAKIYLYKDMITKNNLQLITVIKESFSSLKYPLTCILDANPELKSFNILKKIKEIDKNILYQFHI